MNKIITILITSAYFLPNFRIKNSLICEVEKKSLKLKFVDDIKMFNSISFFFGFVLL